jgi:transcriptional regulator with XRE-family HTH domain
MPLTCWRLLKLAFEKLGDERRPSAELAAMTDLHRKYGGNLERGKSNVSLLTIVKLAHSLNVTPVNQTELVR